jgi:hypothetical protein
VTRADIEAEAWLNSGLPSDICSLNPELREFGLYRKLDDGRYEVIPYCAPQSRDYTAFRSDKLKEFLDALLPKETKERISSE